MRTPFPIVDQALAERLARPGYPRSAAYDPWWVVENLMGPHPLWLAESLTDLQAPASGTRVLDLGCGKALTSIFLAHEFGVRVTAADLWIPAEENLERIEAAGMAELVVPIWAEAHSLPFEPGSFDAIVSFDAYQYFGTADLYLAYLVVSFLLWRQTRWPLPFAVLVLLAGLLPILIFFIEHAVNQRVRRENPELVASPG